MKAAITGLCLLALAGCKRQGGEPGAAGSGSSQVIQVQGSDTIVNLVQAWAEAYSKAANGASIEVGGGGSGVGIAALINGTIDIATASRDMKPDERSKAKSASGKDPVEFTVGYDCLAVYVHRDNPLNEITVEQLRGIYQEEGKLQKWADLGVKVPGCRKGEIIRISRQSSSGTFEFFRDHVLNKKDFELGTRDMNGSKEVVELVGNTPCAIGYSGMGYASEHVKMLRVSSGGAPAVPPNIESAQNKTYPIARPLFLYTLGEPQGVSWEFLKWIYSEEGQKIVEESGYVPVPLELRPKFE